MEWEDILWELIELVENAAPKMWQIAVKQVYVQALQKYIISGILLLSGVFLFFNTERLNKKNEEEDNSYSGEWRFLHLITIILFIIILGETTAAIGCSINPEYYAIKTLVGLVNGGI